MSPPELAERLEEARVVLVRPAACRVEQKPLARLVSRPKDLVVDSEVDRPHPLLREPEPLDERPCGVLGDGQDETASSSRPAVDPAPVGALGAREEVGEKLVLDVEDRRRRATGWRRAES